MIIVLVTDTFNINNNGVTISAMRFAESLTKHGHKFAWWLVPDHLMMRLV